jgi:DNA-binding Lrp family transcriptional regulator
VTSEANRKLTKDGALDILSSGKRPVWTVIQFAEEADVSRTTAKRRLRELEDTEHVDTIKVSNATAYYAVGVETQPNLDLSEKEEVRRAVQSYWNDRYVGEMTEPSVIETSKGEKLTAGDKAQFVVSGSDPRMSNRQAVLSYDDRIEELPSDRSELEKKTNTDEEHDLMEFMDIVSEEYDDHYALLTGELEGKFTVPITEGGIASVDTRFPSLQKGTRWEFERRDGVPHLAVAGTGAYLLRPCENAVFLHNVEVDDLNLAGEKETDDDDEDLLGEVDIDTEDLDEDVAGSYEEFEQNPDR